MSLQEIEASIAELSAQEVDELRAWLEEYQAKMWDKQIEQDLEVGRLDVLLSEVDREIEGKLLAALDADATEMGPPDWDQLRERVRRTAANA